MSVYRVFLLALVLSPVAVRAADLPVSYTVNETALKSAIAGTNLTFDLYLDSSCAGPIVHTETVAIENVEIVSRLKLFKVKNGPKPPKTDELRHTVTGVTQGGNLFLTVTGTGVVPVGGACQAQAAQVALPTCNDGIQNQGESDVDCGGATICLRCGIGQTCGGNGDCTTNNCIGGTCDAAASCTDGIQDGGETGVDCGGLTACPRCGTGQGCTSGSDCVNLVCMGSACQAPTCSDGVKNGNETDIDCGGGTCSTCATTKHCLVGSDCTTGICSMGMCQ